MKFVFSLLTVFLLLFLFSCTDNLSEDENPSLEDSISLTFSERTGIEGSTGLSARTIRIDNYNPYQALAPSYPINGELFSDDGKGNDKVAHDNIYTSHTLRLGAESEKLIGKTIVSNSFAFDESIKQTHLKGGKFKFGCDIGISFNKEDTTLFGNSCETGCIEISNCSFEFEWEW